MPLKLDSWVVGVTVGPRAESTLERTLASITAAGFPKPRLFVDGDFDVPEGFDVTRRTPHIGGWPNFLLGLNELVARSPGADVFLMVQDDVVFCRNLVPYIRRAKLPDDTGVFSPFCPACNNHRRASPKGKHYRGDGLHHIDGAVGEWCRLAGKQALFHSPSLAQHIGESSIMYPGFTGKRDRRFADSFPGEELDADTVLRRYSAELEIWLSAGGSSEWVLPAAVWAAISAHLRPDMRTLEAGSGLTTKLFVDAGCQHTALEHSPEWADRVRSIYPSCASAIRDCPLVGDPPWYDIGHTSEPYDIILIDGPPGSEGGRRGIISRLSALTHDKTVVFVDDSSRSDESQLLDELTASGEWSAARSTGGRYGFAMLNRVSA